MTKKNLCSIDHIIDDLNANLENFARSVVLKEIDLEEDLEIQKRQKQFLNELDSPMQHQSNWHQWGIITHTRNFLKMYETEIRGHLSQWGISTEIEDHFDTSIDGVSRAKLLHIAILLHDIGKFRKNYSKKSDGSVIYTFNEHEVYSQKIIQDELYSLLQIDYKLTSPQIEYIAQCARYHFELGFVREIGKKSSHGYSISFAHSQEFKDAIYNALPEFRKYKIEVGVLFLADSYAKTDIPYHDRSDEEILRELHEKGLEAKLIQAVKQKPVNIEITKSYFDLLFGA